MSTLFPVPSIFPPGFSYFPAFITTAEESSLVAAIAGLELHPFIFQGYTANRKVASFGYDYSFTNRQLSRGKDIPPLFSSLIEKTAGRLGISSGDIAELLVTEYPPGAVINWHRDAPPFDIIIGISLAEDCIFKLRPHDKARQGRGTVRSFPVERRSLYVMRDEARTEWQHSTAPVKATRYSITLRTLRKTG